MKILIANDGMHAHYHERLAWANAFNSIPGVQCYLYDVNKAVAFDLFDTVEPDIFLGQLYNLNEATYKCLLERPHIKVALRAGEYSDLPINDHILRATNAEILNLKNYLNKGGNLSFIYSHYLQKDIEITHSKFLDMNIAVLGVPMSADVHTYSNGVYREDLACDIGFVGGYWPYKGQIIDQYLTPICFEEVYNIKIFGNQVWPHVRQYCGLINDSYVASLFKSAKICPNLSEPHSHTLGMDINERAFKILAAGGFCIMDSVRAAEEIFEGIVFAKSPNEFHKMIHHYLSPKRDNEREKTARIGRQHVLRNHTNYHRVYQIAIGLGENILADEIGKKYNDHINSLL